MGKFLNWVSNNGKQVFKRLNKNDMASFVESKSSHALPFADGFEFILDSNVSFGSTEFQWENDNKETEIRESPCVQLKDKTIIPFGSFKSRLGYDRVSIVLEGLVSPAATPLDIYNALQEHTGATFVYKVHEFGFSRTGCFTLKD